MPAMKTDAHRSARPSASASSRKNGRGSCARCAARPSSTSAAGPVQPRRTRLPPPLLRPPRLPYRPRLRPQAAADMRRPRLALVPGEPAGVGPELCARALARNVDPELVVYGDGSAIERAAQAIGLALPAIQAVRAEERRVGKGCRPWRSP